VVYRKRSIGESFYHIDVAFDGRGGRNSDPMPPNPPSLDTAAASSPDVHVPIGARMIGTSRPRSSHRHVFNIVLPPQPGEWC